MVHGDGTPHPDGLMSWPSLGKGKEEGQRCWLGPGDQGRWPTLNNGSQRGPSALPARLPSPVLFPWPPPSSTRFRDLIRNQGACLSTWGGRHLPDFQRGARRPRRVKSVNDHMESHLGKGSVPSDSEIHALPIRPQEAVDDASPIPRGAGGVPGSC